MAVTMTGGNGRYFGKRFRSGRTRSRAVSLLSTASFVLSLPGLRVTVNSGDCKSFVRGFLTLCVLFYVSALRFRVSD